MENIQRGGLNLYQFSNLGRYGEISHFITSREGGFSKGPFKSLNTGFHVGDNDWDVLQNRKKLAHMLGCDLGNFTFASQTHSSNLAIIDVCKKGKGSTDFETAIANTDGMITGVPGIYICIQVADCVPILLYDPRQKVVAAVHAGWRGTVRRITEAAVKMMMHTFQSQPSDIIAGIGPSNGPCCYEVGEDVHHEVCKCLDNHKDVIKPADKPGKYYFDQWRANYLQLRNWGIPEENIETAGICSQCHSETFFSARKDEGVTGRTTAGIMLKKTV